MKASEMQIGLLVSVRWWGWMYLYGLAALAKIDFAVKADPNIMRAMVKVETLRPVTLP